MTAALNVKHLGVQWPDTDTPALHEVFATAAPARWTAIIGPNGAGKSTLLRAVAGLLPLGAQLHGDIEWQGRPINTWSRQALARHVAWLGQGEQGAEEWRALDVVRLGRLPSQTWWPSASDPEDERIVEATMRQTDTWSLRHTPLGSMSGGERQRVRLARVMAVRAKVLLMDEPLANLDPPHQADWLQWIQALTGQGHTVISVLHELNIALRADHIWLVAQGRVLAQGRASYAPMRAAIEAAFDHRISLHPIQDQWVALPQASKHSNLQAG